MSDDPSDALVKVAAEKAGEEVGAILRPVANIVERLYGDAIEPGMEEVGKLVKDSISLLRTPVEWAAGKKAQFIADSLRRVPEEQRVEVHVALLGPVLDGARYHDQGTPLYEMFAELLARGFDSERQFEAHPAYVVVLGQLSPDEAHVLDLTSRAELEIQSLRARPGLSLEELSSYMVATEFDEELFVPQAPREWPFREAWRGHEVLHYPEQMSFYYEHMKHLGLLELRHEARALRFPQGRARTPETLGAEENVEGLYLTRFGRGFVEACIPETREWGW